MKIVIVDYGMGNIRSIVSTLKYLQVDEIVVSSDRDEIAAADKIILPGVGSFGEAMGRIRELELDTLLYALAIDRKVPFLGICLGMQLMGVSSTEDGYNTGLGLVNGVVEKFDSAKFKVPHVGFNQVRIDRKSLKLYEDLAGEPDFYFTHSYRMISNFDINQCICDYGGHFVASFEVDNIAGVQYHPELSQTNGLKLLKNFIHNF